MISTKINQNYMTNFYPYMIKIILIKKLHLQMFVIIVIHQILYQMKTLYHIVKIVLV